MPRVSVALLTLACVLCAAPAGATGVVRLNSPVAVPGGVFALEAVLDGDPAPQVGRAEIELTLPTGVRIHHFSGVPDCTVDPAAGQPQAAFSFRPAGCTPATCTGIRASVQAAPGAAIPPGARMFSCRGTVAPQAAPLSQPFGCTALLTASGGESIPGTCNPAQMTIANPTQPRLAIGSAPAAGGDEITLDVALETRGASVATAQGDLHLPAGVDVPARPDGAPDCELAPGVDKLGVFTFQPLGCSPGVDCRAVRMAALDVEGPISPIADLTHLFRCRVRLAEDLGPGRHPLDCDDHNLGDSGGAALASSCTSGQVRVPNPGIPDLVIGNASGAPGQAFPIQVSLATKQQPLLGFQLDIVFPTGVMVLEQNGEPDCFGPSAYFGFQPFGCSPPSTCRAVRGVVLKFSPPPLADGTAFTCLARAAQSVVPGTYRLGCAEESGVDLMAGEDEMNCLDGSLLILGPTPGPTAPPTRTRTQTHTRTSTPTTTPTDPNAPTPTATPSTAPVPCAADCNRNGALTAGDIARINATILRCGPCSGGLAGGVAGGCDANPLGCSAADFNGDGCLRASELGRANQNILRFPPDGCPTPTPSPAICGNNQRDGDEECDDGNNHGADGCAANCTLESDATMNFGSLATSQSRSTLQTALFAIPLDIVGRQVITVGRARSQASAGVDGFTNFAAGELPLVTAIAKNTDEGDFPLIDAIPIPGLACACLRGVELRTCGGRPVLPGTVPPQSETICNDDPSICDGHPAGPCRPAFGPGVSAAGRAGCDTGIAQTFASYTLTGNGTTGEIAFSGHGGSAEAGAAYQLAYVAIGTVQDAGTCEFNPSDPRKGPDGILCNEDDPAASRGTPRVSLLTTGTAAANVLNANGNVGTTIAAGLNCGALPCLVSETGSPIGCEALQSGNLEGFCLASAHPDLTPQATGDIVLPTRFCGVGE